MLVKLFMNILSPSQNKIPTWPSRQSSRSYPVVSVVIWKLRLMNFTALNVIQVLVFDESMSEELQLVNTRLSTLETAVAELTSVLKKLTTPGNEPSAQATENKSEQSSTEGTVTTAEDGHVNSAEQQGQESTAQAVSDQVPDATGFPTDIQKDFGHIRDTLNRVKLPSTYN